MKKLAWVALFTFVAALAGSGCVVDPTYTYCTSTSECEVAEQCYEVSTTASAGAFCSSTCSSDGQCERNLGFNGSCMVVDRWGGICFQECDFDSDCFSSSNCYDFEDETGYLNAVCLPTRL